MPHSTKGVIAGFIATVVISVIMLLLTAMGLPQFDIVTLIDRLGSIGRGGAWVDHFIVGALLWGPIFSGFESVTAPAPIWQKGLIFGGITWLLMMVIFMPVVGAGFFGIGLGLAEPLGMLFLHLVYGLVLGVTFGVVDVQVQALANRRLPRPE